MQKGTARHCYGREWKERSVMVVRDLFYGVDNIRVIARAIFEDDIKNEFVDDWIIKYYAQLIKLKNSKVRKSDIMFYLSVGCGEKREYGIVSGFKYSDIKEGKAIYYAIEYLNNRKYASLYVPEYIVQRYGKEVVAAEALREYGWNGYDEGIICPNTVRKSVVEALATMESGVFPTDKEYFGRCRKQFQLFHEGKEISLWKEDKSVTRAVGGGQK